MKNILKHLKIWVLVNKLNIMTITEYRADTIFYFLASLGWFLSSIFFFEIVFQVNDSLGGWNRGEMLLVYALHNLSFAFTLIFIWNSIHKNFGEAVRMGTLDLKIVKPVNLRFFTTTGVFDIAGLLHLIPASSLLFYSLNLIGYRINWINISLFILLFLIGQFLTYNMLCILYFFSFWTKSAENFGQIFWTLQGQTRIPFNVFPVWIQSIFLFIAPIAFFVFLPFKAALGLIETGTVMIGILLCVIFWVISQAMLKSGLKQYESVSG